MSIAPFRRPEQHPLPSVLRHQAAKLGDAPFFTWCDDPPLSFGATDQLSESIARGLRSLGVRQGDRVALVMPNCAEFVPLWFAVSKLGAIEVPVNPDLKGRLLAHVLSNSGSRVVVAHQSRLENLATARSALTAEAHFVIVGGSADQASEHGLDPATEYADLTQTGGQLPRVSINFGDPMAFLYTSGTTGVAKGVIVSYEHAYVFADRTGTSMGMDASDAYFSPLPLFHIDAQVFGTFLPLMYGARCTLAERFSASRYWDQIRASHSTVTNMLGSMAHVLWKQPVNMRDADHPLRVAQCIPMIERQKEFEHRFGLALVTGYGQTETSLIAYTKPGEFRPGSCGRVMPGFQLEIVDPDDRLLPRGSIGEIVVRSEHPHWITTGYHSMPEETVKATRNLWFHTGDAGHLDADGWLYFDGRIKDAIRRRGENISAEELESVVNEHSDVVESAAVAVPSELTEDDIRIFVVRRPSSALTPSGLLDHCQQSLPWFMVPRYVDIWDSQLPRTPSEKIAKSRLRDLSVDTSWDREANGYEVRRPPPASSTTVATSA